MTNVKRIEQVTEEASRQGWRVAPTKKGGLMFLPPNGGRPIMARRVPKTWRNVQNLLSEMRRQGLVYHE